MGENRMVNDGLLCANLEGLTQNETSIAVSGEVVLVAFNDSRVRCAPGHASVGWGYSLNGGATWTDGGGLPGASDLGGGDPWVGISPDGTTFYLSGLWGDFIPHGIGFYRGWLVDNRIVWSDPPVVLEILRVDKEAFAVDPRTGTLYMTYSKPRDTIELIRSTDQGQTWSEPVTIYNDFSQAPFPVVDANGTLYVAYYAGPFPIVSGEIHVDRSTDGGQSFVRVARFPFSTQDVTFLDRSPPYPQIAVDLSTGARRDWIYVVWHARSPQTPQGVLRPYVSHSEDHGSSWSAPIAVNSDETTAFHWWPSVSVDNSGNVNIVFMDRRLNPGTALTDVFLAQSTDGARSFSDLRVTDVSASWEEINYDFGFTYAGDYIRAVSVGTDIYAAWTDTRNGNPDIYFSRIAGGPLAERLSQ